MEECFCYAFILKHLLGVFSDSLCNSVLFIIMCSFWAWRFQSNFVIPLPLNLPFNFWPAYDVKSTQSPFWILRELIEIDSTQIIKVFSLSVLMQLCSFWKFLGGQLELELNTVSTYPMWLLIYFSNRVNKITKPGSAPRAFYVLIEWKCFTSEEASRHHLSVLKEFSKNMNESTSSS